MPPGFRIAWGGEFEDSRDSQQSLIPGMIPLRLEAIGPVVQIVYPLAEEKLLLIQQVENDQVVYRLVAPAEFPLDSLERLRARVRE